MNASENEKMKKMLSEMEANASSGDINKIDAKIGKMNKGKLKAVWDDIMAMWKLIKDPNAAKLDKAIAIAVLLYVVSPIDVIPDIIPIVGLMDDAAAVAYAVIRLGSALSKYKR